MLYTSNSQVPVYKGRDAECMCSVLFNFLGRDFFNALSQKDAERFTQMLFKWLGGIALGVPVFVYRDYLQVSCTHTTPIQRRPACLC